MVLVVDSVWGSGSKAQIGISVEEIQNLVATTSKTHMSFEKNQKMNQILRRA